MITRRQALKIATAATAARPAISPKDAAAELDKPLDRFASPDSEHPGDHLDDPASFAWSMSGSDDLWDHVAPEQIAEYSRQRAAVEALLPVLKDVPPNHPWDALDNAAVSVWVTAYEQGLGRPTRTCASPSWRRGTSVAPVTGSAASAPIGGGAVPR
jgi:hypothetical protein